MSQLALFDVLPTPLARATQPAPKRVQVADEVRARWTVGMLVSLPITVTIQGEKWRQYTMGLSGYVEVIEGDLAGVRVRAPNHKFDGRLAVVELRRAAEPRLISEAEL